MKNITIFDLDGTCIDSTHRQATRQMERLTLSIGLRTLHQKRFLVTAYCHWLSKLTSEPNKAISLLFARLAK